MPQTSNLQLPYLAAAQAQKHVTHNEALRILDGIVQMAVVNRVQTAPPVSPAEGSRYIPASPSGGEWAGWENSVAYWTDGAWMRLMPAAGWTAWIEDEAQAVVWTGSSWVPMADAMGFIAQSSAVEVARSASGATSSIVIIDETLTGLSGATVDSSVTIPNRAVVTAVTVRTSATISGATSFDCGIAGDPSKFGGSLGVSAGSTNVGVIGPQAFYAPTPIRLTANGGSFSGGEVKIAIHCQIFEPPA
ncbi:MAG: DUF2793 domain-containing protein [Paracoccus sp. (in: a-proteobacteria)]